MKHRIALVFGFLLHRNGQTSFMFINRQGNPSNHDMQITILQLQFKIGNSACS